MRRRLLNIKQVCELTATPRSTLYAWSADIKSPFPKPLKIAGGRRGMRWDAEEINNYVERAVDERDERLAKLRGIIRLDQYQRHNRRATG